jgi:hypothetical protein
MIEFGALTKLDCVVVEVIITIRPLVWMADLYWLIYGYTSLNTGGI